MNQIILNEFATESATQLTEIRHAELKNQLWSRSKSQRRAQSEGIQFSDEHWKVIMYMRQQYLEVGLPRHARNLADKLRKNFSTRGGTKYLRHLFPGGPIIQGSRLANLPTPADVMNSSHGSCY
jgi:tRNA 2-thiouridine synthesizing protein E